MDNNEKVSPLTPEERSVSDHAVATWLGFLALPQSHPSDVPEVHAAIHVIQKTLGMRLLRREHPEIWPDNTKHVTQTPVRYQHVSMLYDFERIKLAFSMFTDAQRNEIMNDYCRDCCCNDSGCQCRNDN